MFTVTFWKQTTERAIKTFAQSALALVGVTGMGVLDVPWGAVASVSGLAALLSLLTSIVSAGVGDSSSPSLVQTR